MEKDTLVVFGSSVKALGDGRIGGYLVLFSTEKDPDLLGDFFTRETDFDVDWKSAKSTVYYQHCLDPVIGARKLGVVAMKQDDVGVWVEGQLEMRDEYDRAIYNLVEQGKLGWSSGTAPHLVERKQVGESFWIKTWPLGLDASLTPTPAEPRTHADTLKSLEGAPSLKDLLSGTPQAEVKAQHMGEHAEAHATMEALRSLHDSLMFNAVEPYLFSMPMAMPEGEMPMAMPEESMRAAFGEYAQKGADLCASMKGMCDQDPSMKARFDALFSPQATPEVPETGENQTLSTAAPDPVAMEDAVPQDVPPAGKSLEDRLTMALEAVEVAVADAEQVQSIRAAEGRTLSKGKRPHLETLKSRIETLLAVLGPAPEADPPAPDDDAVKQAIRLRQLARKAEVRKATS